MTRRLTWSGVLASAVLAVVACSSSSESPATSDGGGDGASFDGRATLPIRELNETGPPVPTGPVVCSGKMCTAPSGGMIPLVACCLSDDTCGLTFDFSQFGGAVPGAGDAGLGCLDPSPGTPDPSCPSQSTMGFTMAGCCSRAGVCGVDLSMATMGAIGCNSGLGSPGLSAGGPSMNAPPQPCAGAAGDASVDGSDGSVGASDAGTAADGANSNLVDAASREDVVDP